MDLFEQIQKLTAELDASIRMLRKNGEAYAEAEKDYKMELAKESLKLRQEEGLPVTMMNLVIYGKKNVAEKRFKRDVEEVNYETNKEHINITKLKLRLLEAQLNREWGASGKGSI